jgi:serine/threonine-protein kinase HipA
MKAQMVFWLLGATDGHAKNFSIFLHPRGGFRLAPLYDVVSLQPAYVANQVKRNRMKLAMSVGSSRHYVVETIKPRHFLQSAEQAGMPASTVHAIAEELLSAWPAALAVASGQLPKDFPARLVDSIVGAAQQRLEIIRADRESG